MRNIEIIEIKVIEHHHDERRIERHRGNTLLSSKVTKVFWWSSGPPILQVIQQDTTGSSTVGMAGCPFDTQQKQHGHPACQSVSDLEVYSSHNSSSIWEIPLGRTVGGFLEKTVDGKQSLSVRMGMRRWKVEEVAPFPVCGVFDHFSFYSSPIVGGIGGGSRTMV